MNNWTYTTDGSQAYAETSDPRVLAVIQRDDDSHGPDGDAIEPAYYLEGNAYGWSNGGRCGSTYDDDEVMDAFTTALDRFEYTRRDDMVRRYMRIFHGTEYRVIDSSISRGAQVVVFNTPAFRSHIGLGDTYTEVATADFQAYIDGEVFAIGYAVQESRVL